MDNWRETLQAINLEKRKREGDGFRGLEERGY